MTKYLDAISNNNEAYKNFMDFMADSIETLSQVQTHSEAHELAIVMRDSLKNTNKIVLNNINNALEQKELVMPEGQPTFAPDYSNRRGYSTPGYDGNIDAENNPSLHINS